MDGPQVQTRTVESEFPAGRVGAGKNMSTPTPESLSFCFQQKKFSSFILEVGKMLFLDMKTPINELGSQVNE